MEELAFSFLARRPDESAVAEGNIAENPIFVLTNKEAKPAFSSKEEAKRLYTRTISISREMLAGRPVERSVTLTANPNFGYPTMFACRVLVALIDEAMKSGLKSDTVEISRNELLRRVGYKKPGKHEYEDLENALRAMSTLLIEFKDTWYDKATRTRPPNVRCDGLISGFGFFDDRQLALLPGGGKTAQSDQRSSVSLSKLLMDSLRAGYLNGIDLEYMNALQSPLAQRLYVYLTKKDARETYSEAIRELGSKLNLKNRKPSAIMGALRPALELLKRGTAVQDEPRPRRFLSDWQLDSERQILTVTFYREVRPVEDLRRRLRPV